LPPHDSYTDLSPQDRAPVTVEQLNRSHPERRAVFMGIMEQLDMINADVSTIVPRLVREGKVTYADARFHATHCNDVCLPVYQTLNQSNIKQTVLFRMSAQQSFINYFLNPNNGIFHHLNQNDLALLALAKEAIDNERVHLGA